MSKSTSPTSRSPLRSLEVFEAFRVARRPLTLSEIARLAGVPVSTCHGVVRALARSGFLYFPSPREVYPTRRLWDLAHEIHEHDPIVARLAPSLARLRDSTGETVILGTRQGDEVLYLLVLEGTRTIRYSARAGEHKPLHSSSIGKVMLAGMAGPELDAWLAAHPLAKVTERTLTSPAKLRADLARSRLRGYFATAGENVADVMAIAVPLAFAAGRFGVAIAGPRQRVSAHEAALARELRRCVESMEKSDADQR